MHIIEAIGVNRDAQDMSPVFRDRDRMESNLENQRRVFWIVRVLNEWIPNEYGRFKVMLRGPYRRDTSIRGVWCEQRYRITYQLLVSR